MRVVLGCTSAACWIDVWVSRRCWLLRNWHVSMVGARHSIFRDLDKYDFEFTRKENKARLPKPS